MTVENQEFQRLFPNFPLPCADTLRNWIMEIFIAKKTETKNYLTSVDAKLSFTVDCWRSIANKNFMGICSSSF